MTKYILSAIFSIVICFSPTKKSWGQCTYVQITHLTGTETVGTCGDVTVTAEGFTILADPPLCGILGPHAIGHMGTGSFLFEFSQPVSSVRIALGAVDHLLPPVYTEERVSFEINGAPYPLTNPGTHITGCLLNTLFINGDGHIACNGQGSGSWEEVIINENMNSLKITDTWLAGSPAGVPFRIEICCDPVNCQTEAGMLTSVPLELCEDELATVSPPTQTFLDGDDLLEYILFSNPADTLGSIIATSSTPEFSFDPGTMQTGVTYYIAAIAGNNAGGFVNLLDPCLDISNAIEVIWHPLPTVSFSVPSPDVCVDDCIDITVSLTGSPPFQLTAEAASGGSVVVTINETISGSTAILPLCVPSGTSIGDLTLTATVLVDNFCTCN